MSPNPVERRIADLCQEWAGFRADPSKRLLIWQAPENAERLLQAFFETQKHETEYSTGDLFIVFDASFEHSIQYSRALKEALAGQYKASREALESQGIACDWHYAPAEFADSATGFVHSIGSFGSHHQEQIGHCVAVLYPQYIMDNDAFAAWLGRALNAGVPEGLRLVVTDSLENPRFNGFEESAPGLVQTRTVQIDSLTLAQQTFAQEDAVGPAAVFRNHLMGLATLLEKGSADQVKAKAADALAFAKKQQWVDQQVVVALLVAGALLKEKRFDEAVTDYQNARQSARQTVDAGHPAGQQLVLQTWFGEAGAHLAAGDASAAGRCYDQAAELAQGIPNLVLAIEAWRMSAFCSARASDREGAIASVRKAFQLGNDLDPEQREMSTLPLTAVDLLRLIEPKRVVKIEKIKINLEQQAGRLRQAVELRSAELEAGADAEQYRHAEEHLARATAQAVEQAQKQLNTLVAGASQPFRHVFTQARNLLGRQWPLFSAAAMPQTPQPDTAHTQKLATAGGASL
jgi:tetratricopeptide (TPR) repeat protein